MASIRVDILYFREINRSFYTKRRYMPLYDGTKTHNLTTNLCLGTKERQGH